MPVKMCSSCFVECGERIESGLTAVAGTHCNNGQSGNFNQGDNVVSDCCGETIEEIDDDLWEYHQDIKRLAKGDGVLEYLSDDPAFYRAYFDDGISPFEVVGLVVLLWG